MPLVPSKRTLADRRRRGAADHGGDASWAESTASHEPFPLPPDWEIAGFSPPRRGAAAASPRRRAGHSGPESPSPEAPADGSTSASLAGSWRPGHRLRKTTSRSAPARPRRSRTPPAPTPPWKDGTATCRSRVSSRSRRTTGHRRSPTKSSRRRPAGRRSPGSSRRGSRRGGRWRGPRPGGTSTSPPRARRDSGRGNRRCDDGGPDRPATRFPPRRGAPAKRSRSPGSPVRPTRRRRSGRAGGAPRPGPASRRRGIRPPRSAPPPPRTGGRRPAAGGGPDRAATAPGRRNSASP